MIIVDLKAPVPAGVSWINSFSSGWLLVHTEIYDEELKKKKTSEAMFNCTFVT